jgi:hypothetical protein
MWLALSANRLRRLTGAPSRGSEALRPESLWLWRHDLRYLRLLKSSGFCGPVPPKVPSRPRPRIELFTRAQQRERLGKLGEALADPDQMQALLTYTQGRSNSRTLAQAVPRFGPFNAAEVAGQRFGGQAGRYAAVRVPFGSGLPYWRRRAIEMPP